MLANSRAQRPTLAFENGVSVRMVRTKKWDSATATDAHPNANEPWVRGIFAGNDLNPAVTTSLAFLKGGEPESGGISALLLFVGTKGREFSRFQFGFPVVPKRNTSPSVVAFRGFFIRERHFSL